MADHNMYVGTIADFDRFGLIRIMADPNDAVQKALEAAKARSVRMKAVSKQHPSLPAQKVNADAGGVWDGLGVSC